MDHAVAVRVVQCLEHLAHDRDRAAALDGALGEQLGQDDTADHLGDDERRAVVESTDVEQLDDVGMAEHADRLALADETRGDLFVRAELR